MAEESRMFRIDRETREELTSDDFERQRDAVLSLPEALTEQEVFDVGLNVGLATAPEAVKEGEALGRQVIFQLGLLAVLYKDDRVTAQSAAKVLKRDIHGLLDYLAIKHVMKLVPEKPSARERAIADVMDRVNSLMEPTKHSYEN